MKKFNTITALLLVITIVFSYSFAGSTAVNGREVKAQAAEFSKTASSTTYDYLWYALWTVRNKIDTTYTGSSTSYSSYSTVDSFKNTYSQPASHTFSDSRTKSSSVSVGGKVTVKAVELEAGGTVEYSQTVAYNTTIDVASRSTATLKVRTRTEKKYYSSVIQRQDLYTDGVWRNVGSSSTSSSTQVITSPDWLLQ
ncbi:MAG: hypothetical protein K6F63_04190 [Lachnospiraceae bacterium]|nr:hypothetical protein [Lachnospiraceae bacterium]